MALQKLQCFFTKVMSPYHFFDGSGPKFFCRVNGLLRMVKRPTELEEQRKLFGFKPQSHTISTFTSSVSLPSRLKRLKNGSGKVFIPVTLGPTSFSFVLVVCVHKFQRGEKR